MRTIIKNKQWLGDIAVERAGSISALFDLAKLNGVSITGDLIVGDYVNTKEVLEAGVVENYKVVEVSPATSGVSATEVGGIGFMSIGGTFKVS